MLVELLALLQVLNRKEAIGMNKEDIRFLTTTAIARLTNSMQLFLDVLTLRRRQELKLLKPHACHKALNLQNARLRKTHLACDVM